MLLIDTNSCHGKEGTYIGCYVDDGHRDLKDGPKKYGYNQQTCNTACQAYTYYSLQNHGWCACGNGYSTKSKYAKKPESECGGTRGLGGPWRNSVYKTCTIQGKKAFRLLSWVYSYISDIYQCLFLMIWRCGSSRWRL